MCVLPIRGSESGGGSGLAVVLAALAVVLGVLGVRHASKHTGGCKFYIAVAY